MPQVSLETFVKYDPQVSSGLVAYVTLHFIVSQGATLFFLFQQRPHAILSLVPFNGLLLLTLASLGKLMEGPEGDGRGRGMGMGMGANSNASASFASSRAALSPSPHPPSQSLSPSPQPPSQSLSPSPQPPSQAAPRVICDATGKRILQMPVRMAAAPPPSSAPTPASTYGSRYPLEVFRLCVLSLVFACVLGCEYAASPTFLRGLCPSVTLLLGGSLSLPAAWCLLLFHLTSFVALHSMWLGEAGAEDLSAGSDDRNKKHLS